MGDLRISEISKLTGFSMRYWQRRAAAGEIPGTRAIQLGERRTFVIDEAKFSRWWRTQLTEVKPCLKTSGGAAASGGIASSKTAGPTKGRFKPQTLESLKNDLKEFAGS